MLKSPFLKLAAAVVVILTVGGVGYGSLVIWRDRVEKETQDEEPASREESPESPSPTESDVPERWNSEAHKEGRVITISIQDRGEKPPSNYGLGKFVPPDGTVIVAAFPDGSTKELPIKRVNDWLHKYTYIEQTYEYFCGAEPSPSGQEILFGVERPPTGLATTSLLIWDVLEDTLQLLPVDGCGGVWSPDGRYIAMSGTGAIGVPFFGAIDVKSNEPLFRDLPLATFINSSFSHWSPDSEQIFFRRYLGEDRAVSSDDPLWVINIDGTGLRPAD